MEDRSCLTLIKLLDITFSELLKDPGTWTLSTAYKMSYGVNFVRLIFPVHTVSFVSHTFVKPVRGTIVWIDQKNTT